MNLERLQEQWKAYIDIPSDIHTSEAKLVELKKFLQILRDDNLIEIPSYFRDDSCLSRVCGVLIGEFQGDLLKVSSESLENDLSKLRGYLSGGRGAVLLQVLSIIGVAEMVDYQRLGNIALWAFKLCLKMIEPSANRCTDIQPTDVNAFFAGTLEDFRYLGNKSVPQTRAVRLHTRNVSPDSPTDSSAPVRQCRLLARKRRQLKIVSLAAETDSEDDVAIKILMPKTRRRSVIPDLTERGRSEASAGDELMDDSSGNLSLSDVLLHLLALLKNIVYMDVQRAGETTACMYLAPVVGTVLCSIISSVCRTAENAIPDQSGSDSVLVSVGRCVVRVFFIMLLRIGEHANGLMALQRCSAILDAVELVDKNVEVLFRTTGGSFFLYDFTVACWLYARGLLILHHRNVVVVNAVLKNIELVTRGRGCNLTSSILVLFSNVASDLDRDNLPKVLVLVESIVDVSRMLKTTRALYVHMFTCIERSHRNCVHTLMKSRHHHDVLGSPLSTSCRSVDACDDDLGCSNADACVVSTICVLLLEVFRRTNNRVSRQHLLSLLLDGTVMCCCVPPAVLVRLLRPDDEASTTADGMPWWEVAVLVDIFVAHCGAGSKLDCCSVCDDGWLDKRKEVPGEGLCSSDSALSGCESNSALSFASRWSCISEVLNLLRYSDSNFTLCVLSQMLRLVVNGSEFLRQQLYKTLYFPVFRSLIPVVLPSGFDGFMVGEGQISFAAFADDPLPAMKVCLCAFSTLLRDPTAHNHFISNGYVGIVYALSKIVSVRHNCLSVLEVVITYSNYCVSLFQTAKNLNDFADDGACDADTALDLFIRLLSKKLPDNNHRSDILDDFDDISSVSDCWSFASRLFSSCSSFRREFVRMKGHCSARSLLTSACRSFLRRKVSLVTDSVQAAMYRSCSKRPVSTANETLRLIYSCMLICLKCKHLDVDFSSEFVLVDGLISELLDVVHHGVSPDCFQLFCEMMLMCVQRNEWSANSSECCCWQLEEVDEDLHHVGNDHVTRTALPHYNFAEQNISKETVYDADQEFTSDYSPDHETMSDRKLRAGKSRGETVSNDVIVHAHICRLVLRLTAVCRNLQGAPLDQEVVANIMFWLVSLVRKSSETAGSLHQQGVAQILLSSYKQWFLQTDASVLAIQRSILELFLLITHHGASTVDLKHLLQLFNEEQAPQDRLLVTLISLSCTLPLQSTYSLCLPTISSNTRRSLDRDNTPSSCDVDDSMTNTTNLDQSMLTTTIRQSQLVAAADSNPVLGDPMPRPMSSSAVSCASLNTSWKMGSLWPNRSSSSFSLSMWLLIEDNVQGKVGKQKLLNRRTSCLSMDHEFSTETCRSSTKSSNVFSTGRKRLKWSDSFIHLVSIGSAELLFEIWVDRCSAFLVARIMTIEAGALTIQCQSRITTRLSLGRWHHIAVAYTEALGSDGTEVMVVTFVDGIEQMSTAMDYKLRQSTANMDSVFYIGHSLVESKDAGKSGSCQLGNLFLFNDFQLNTLTSCYLYTLGPDCCTLAECDSSEQTVVYVRHITRALITSPDVIQELLGLSNHQYLDKMRSSVVLMYTPRNPMTLSIFQQPPVSGSSPNSSSVSHSIAVFSLPLKSSADCIERSVNRGTSFSIRQLGGIRVFIYLFAKVVERSTCELEQANALRLVFTLIHRDIQLAREFVEADCYEMIAKVFVTNRCIMGYEILKVLTDSCATGKLMVYNDSQQKLKFVINKENVALISDVKIILEMLLSWRSWEKSEDGVFLMALQALNSLVRAEHPYRQYNVEQYRRAGVIGKLLDLCKERLQESRPSYSLSICNAMLSLLRSTIGNQLVIHNVISICDFLLLMHPAASTFVEQNKTRFWFRNKWIVSTGGDSNRPTSSLAARPSVASDIGSFHGDENRTVSSVDSATVNVDRSSSGPEETVSCAANPSVAAVSVSLSQTPPNGTTVPDGGSQVVTRNNTVGKFEVKLRQSETISDEDPAVEDVNSAVFSVTDLTGRSSPSSVRDQRTSEQSTGPEKCDSDERVMACGPSDVGSSDVTPSNKFTDINTFVVDGSDSDCFVDVRNADGTTSFEIDASNATMTQENDVEIRSRKLPDQVDALDQSLMMSSLSSSVESSDDGLVYIMAGLLDLLGKLLHTLSAVERSRLFSLILKPDMLIVMANHSAMKIRTAVIKFFLCYWQLMSPAEKTDFKKCNGFHILANQLHQHHVNGKLIETCESYLTGKTVAENVDVEPLFSLVLMSLVENTVDDMSLCHDTLCAVTKVFMFNGSYAMLMLSNGLPEVLCNVLHRLHASWASGDVTYGHCDTGDRESIGALRNTVMDDIQRLFCCIAHTSIRLLTLNNEAFDSISLPGENWYQQFKDTVALLQSLEARQKDLHGETSDAALNVVHIECRFLQTALQFFSEQIDELTCKMSADRVSRLPSTVENILSKITRYFSESSAPATVSNGVNFCDYQLYDSQLYHFTAPVAESTHRDGAHRNFSSLFTARGFESTNRNSTNHRASSFARETLVDSIVFKLLGGNRLSKNGDNTSNTPQLTSGEMTNRFRRAVVIAVNYSLFCFERPPVNDVSMDASVFGGSDEQFCRYLLEFLMKALVVCLKNGSTRLNCTIAAVLWHAKDNLREQFSRLVSYTMSPSSTVTQRIFVLGVLMNETAIADVFKQTLSIKMTGQKLASYCYALVTENVDKLSTAQRAEASDLLLAIKRCDIAVVNVGSRLSESDKAAMLGERNAWRSAFIEEKNKWLQSHGLALQRVLHRLDSLLAETSEHAADVTKLVSSDQNALRKKFINELKLQMSAAIYIKKVWQQTVLLLTHERGVWYNPKTYPMSWELDLTEGPSRMRRRLQRCYLRMKPVFLLPEHRHKLGDRELPLSYLFDDDSSGSESAVLIFKLFASNNIDHTFSCSYVTPQTTVSGSLLIGQSEIFFVADTAASESSFMQHQALLGNCDTLVLTLPHEQVQEFHKQWHMLKDNALEIFLANGKTCLLAFKSTRDRDELAEVLIGLDFPNHLPADDLPAIQQRWLSGQMTNFDYLIQLNKLAGRSMNDLMQYPIFPFVLAQYSQPQLDLCSPDVYRNLSKTISTQTKEMADKYVGIYQQLSDNQILCRNEGLDDSDDDIMYAPYHYSNHCSNICTVLQFLVRLPPFTQLFINFQDNHFDVPDRTFHSIHKCYQLVTVQSVTDTKELIPEFFYLPEFLENGEGFDFGVMQNEERVNGVKLPPWCHNDARLFTLIHRQALESEYVRKTLPGWIDLVFGYKQRGKAAVDALNVFHPSSYFGIEVENITETVKRNAVVTMIRTTGQTPKQLFNSPHQVPSPRVVTGMKGADERISPIQNITGLQWGDYVGSPDWPEPVVTWSSSYPSAPVKLVSLSTGEIFGLNRTSSLLIRETASMSQNVLGIEWLGIISWNHADSIIRVRQSRRRTQPPINFIHWPASEQVTCCTGVSDCRQLFIGCESGVISVFNTTYNPRKELSLQVFDRRLCLFGHTGAISSLQVCKPFSILVSASHDGTSIIWDLNRLNYVHTLDAHDGYGIVALCVSPVSGEIASASHGAMNRSRLAMHTINGKLVARVECSDLINCLAITSAPEGQSVNMIAAGLSAGKIRLFSSWTLTPIRELVSSAITSAIVSIAYTADAQCLYCSTLDGFVHVWTSSSPSSRNKPLRFVSYAERL